MADGILGLGSDGSANLNSDLIATLKEAETVALIDPITADIEDNEIEITVEEEIETKVLELLELIETFDLYTSGTGAFDEIVATTSGEAATFDALDTSDLEEGTINISISQLAQKDIYQSDLISDTSAALSSGSLILIIDGENYTIDVEDMSYDALVSELNTYDAIEASLEEVSDSAYRMVIKSKESGETNQITISSDVSELNFLDEDNHVLSAQNMQATVDGIDYDLSKNQIVLSNGLDISAISLGDSSITLTRDNSSLVTSIEEIAMSYNELLSLVDSNIYGDEDASAIISDSSTLKTLMSAIKEIFFDSYGLEEEESIFAYGISFDSDGFMQVDSDDLSSAVASNYEDLKELFVGYAEKEGIGTRLKTYLDSLDGFDGLLTAYSDKLSERATTLEEDKETAIEKLDDKYDQMAQQFADYTVIITQMENQFASLQAIIDAE